MKNAKKKRLEAQGWRVGSAQDFLGLSGEEAAIVETKLRLSRVCESVEQGWRCRRRLAKRLHSSQSRVAKMEAADATVSVDLLLRALFALGATPKDVAAVIRKPLFSAA